MIRSPTSSRRRSLFSLSSPSSAAAAADASRHFLIRSRFSSAFNVNINIMLTSSDSTGVPRAALLVMSLSFAVLLLLCAASASGSLPFFSLSSGSFPFIFPSLAPIDSLPLTNEQKLEKVLKEAAMEDKTVILTTLNEAWAAPNSVLDLFLASFRLGEHTYKLLNHLVIIALDHKAYARCKQVHRHCYALLTDGIDFNEEAYFMTPAYLKMMWRRIDFLRSVLEMGYNFVFTDADVMWFRDPFPRFYSDADFQIACDHFTGSSVNTLNKPNGGFNYVKSNNRSIEFYKFWYSSRDTYPGNHDQDVLNKIKADSFIGDLGLKMRFLDTAFFGGLCEPSKDLNLVRTMHANCCYGLDSKLQDLRIMLQDWKLYKSLPPNLKRSSIVSWRVPKNCSLDSLRHYGSPQTSVQQGPEG